MANTLFGNYLAQGICAAVGTTGTTVSPAHAHFVRANATNPIWMKLHSGDPGADGSANVVTAFAAASQEVSFGDVATTTGSMSNTGAVTWTANADIATISHWSIWEPDSAGHPGAPAAGKCLFYGVLLRSISVANADTVTCAAGGLTINLMSTGMSTWFANAILNAALKDTPVTTTLESAAHATPSLSHQPRWYLYSTLPGANDTGTKVTYDGTNPSYAPFLVAISPLPTGNDKYSINSGGQVQVADAFTAGAGTQICRYVGLHGYETGSAGYKLLMAVPLPSPVSLTNGNQPAFATSSIGYGFQ